MNYENYDLIITPNKTNILKEISLTKKIVKTKLMTIQEFKNNYFGTYDTNALYYLVDNYHYKPSIAKNYLDSLFPISPKLQSFYNELINQNLIKQFPNFKNTFHTILVDTYNLDPYIKKELEQYKTTYLTKETGNNTPKVFSFKTIDDEINYIATDIIERTKTIDINNIYIANVDSTYEIPIKRIFKMYNLPINLSSQKSIYKTTTVKQFLTNLKSTQDIKIALETIHQNDIYNKIIDIVNKYANQNKYTDTLYKCIDYELKHATISLPKLYNAINTIDIDNIEAHPFKYYYIVGLNQNVLPKIYKDESILNDQIKSSIGLFTSQEKTINEKNKLINIIKTTPNLFLSYKLSTPFNSYYPSSIIDELNLEVEQKDIKPYYSNLLNKLTLCSNLDNLIKYNELTPITSTLYHQYPNIEYRSYNNNYNKINYDNFQKYIKKPLTLSYSSLDNYFKCGFRYYLNNILNLNIYEESLPQLIGNTFHYVLSKMYDQTFDLDTSYQDSIKDKQLSPKEEFFLSILKKDLKIIIDIIRYQDTHSTLNNALTEQKISIKKTKEVTFTGIVDKIKYEESDKKYLAIIDYKTGSLETDLSNLSYGLNLQLPVYIYMVNSQFEDIEIVGFYLQKILNSKQMNDEDKTIQSKLKLDGISNSNEDILSKIDNGYQNSTIIKGMKTTETGFGKYAKVLTSDQISHIASIVDIKIDEAIEKIMDVNFDINPKRIDDELIGCKYCKYQDICYRKEENIINLKNQTLKEVLGGEENAELD